MIVTVTGAQTQDESPGTLILWLLLLFLTAWVPRALALDAFVTADERKWLNRSANFSYALSQGAYAETFQKEHPGVTVTWIGAAALRLLIPDYVNQVDGAMTDRALERWLPEEAGVTPLSALVNARQAMILVIALLLALCFLPLRALLPRLPALLAVMLVSWSPFLLGLSRLFHPDGLLAALTLPALLFFIAWLHKPDSWSYLFASGFMTGAAILTKVPAAILIPTAILVTLFVAFGHDRRPQRMAKCLIGLVAWGLLAATTFVAAWPAMWLDPRHVINRIVLEMRHYQVDGHSLPSFFWGEIVHDPGVLFYPAAWVIRSSPIVLFGFAFAVIVLVRGVQRGNIEDGSVGRGTDLGKVMVESKESHNNERLVIIAALLFGLIFFTMVTLSAKKFDRYILPAMTVMVIPAAIGWYAAIVHFVGKRSSGDFWKAIGVLLLVLLQGLFTFTHAPYYLTYFSPLTGGTSSAPRQLMVGWGEGLEQAAQIINIQPDGADARVVGWYGDGPISYYLDSEKSVLSFFESENYWVEADYAVVYANQWQRLNPDADLFTFLAGITPLKRIRANGLELARVYNLHSLEPPAYTGLHRLQQPIYLVAGKVVAYRVDQESLLPGEAVTVTVLLEPSLEPGKEVQFVGNLTLSGPAGAVWHDQGIAGGFDPDTWDNGRVYEDRYVIDTPVDLSAGTYDLRFQQVIGNVVADPTGGDTLGSITIQEPVRYLPDATWEGLSVSQISHAAVVEAGIPLLITLDAAGRVDGTLKVSLRLLDRNGKPLVQQDKELLASTRFDFPIPQSTAPGKYTLAAVVYSAETLEALPDVADQRITPLSLVEIR